MLKIKNIKYKNIFFISLLSFMIFAVGVCGLSAYYAFALPSDYVVTGEDILEIKTAPITAVVSKNDKAVFQYYNDADEKNTEKMNLKLFGLFNVKEVNVKRVDEIQVIPSGTPFGIKMLTKGVVVIGLGDVSGYDGVNSPAKAGIKEGDIIKSVNGIEVNSNSDIAKAVQSDSEKTKIIFERNGKEQEITLTPIKSKIDDQYRIGMWVRDSSAGIGTLTYYNPATKEFGGLGHGVCDVDTGILLPLGSGQVVSVAIGSVTKGHEGKAGELNGSFISLSPIGNISANTDVGLFGTMDNAPIERQPVKVQMKQNIKVGPAKIYTTINGTEPKEYDILIEKIDYNYENMSKNMVIKITDKDLLSQSGGIVQGMSGSPIVQDGCLVGAVTHVFVSDPTRGFGIFAENMIFEQNQQSNAKQSGNLDLVA